MSKRLIPALLALLLLSGLATAAPMSVDDEHDLGALLEQADNEFGLADKDAVLLVEERSFRWTADGRRVETVHRAVWINTEYGLESFADLRVPWDSDRQTLKVNALRVWRDNRWIEHRPTAIVETLPFAIASAPDYANMRETMLLHDGVELPCILETEYVIEDSEPFRGGMEGSWSFQHDHPVMVSRLVLEAPADAGLLPAVTGAGEPELGTVDGLDSYTWTMGPLDPAPLPETLDPMVYLPHVTWSTFGGWDALGSRLRQAFDDAAVLDDTQKQMLAKKLADADSDYEKAAAVAELVAERTSLVHYDSEWFLTHPRKASRTDETAYGHRLDRAVLTAALLREAGLKAWPYFASETFADVNEGPAALSRFREIAVWTSGEELEAMINPASMTVHNGFVSIFQRTIWIPGSGDVPTVRYTGVDQPSTFTSEFELTWDREGGFWRGEGEVDGSGALCPYDVMQTEEMREGTLNAFASAVVPGGEVSEIDLEGFDPFTVEAEFMVAGDSVAADRFGRLPLRVGDAAPLMNGLPHHIHLYDAERSTPVLLPAAMSQTVTVELRFKGLDVVALPEAVTIENEAGTFQVTVESKGSKATFTRSLKLNADHYEPAQWPALRELLLAEKAERFRTFLFE